MKTGDKFVQQVITNNITPSSQDDIIYMMYACAQSKEVARSGLFST